MATTKFDARHHMDMTVNDPPFLDPEFPPEQFVTCFESGGQTVHATVWLPNGAELKPCVILSPQLFGGDRLESIIIPLVNSGIGVCTFHPRGMWDSASEYSFLSALEDIKSAVAFVAASAGSPLRTPRGNICRLDPERIVVAGLSGGGGSLGLAACAEEERLTGVVAIAPGNFELNRDPASIDAAAPFFSYMKAVSNGRIDLENLLRSLKPADFDRISPIAQAKKLASKPILLIGGDRDVSTPIESCHRPIAAALNAAGAQRLTEIILEADHSFLTKRIALARIIIAWLRSECRF